MFIETIKLSRKQFEKSRKNYIGASELGTILGLNKKETPKQLFERKLNGESKLETQAMRAGTTLEPAVAKLFQKETKIKVRKNKTHYLIDGFLIATPDYFTIDGKVIEIKVTNEFAYSSAKKINNIPEYYYPQIQTYLHLAKELNGQDEGFFIVSRGSNFDIIVVKYDKDYWQYIYDKAKEFHTMIINGSFEEEIQDTIDIVQEDNPEIENLYNELLQIQGLILELNKQKDELVEKIKEYMTDKKETKYAKWVEQLRFDSKKFKSENPELYEKYLITSKILKINYKGDNNE